MTDLLSLSEAAIAQGSQSFASAARLMPAAIRADTVMLYAWCRHADDVIDGQVLGHASSTPADPGARLAGLRAETLAALRTDAPVAAPFAALRAVARRNELSERWPLDLIDGFAMDVEGRHYRTLQETLDYSYHVAGVVGVMMARVMGVRESAVLDRACDLGLAFQLTNIARDVMDDARIGRIYLPQDWLDEAGAKVEGDVPSPALLSVILRLLDAAEPYYASALAGLPALPPRCAWSIAAAARIYRAIGTRICHQGAEGYRQRITTSGAMKAALASRAVGDAAWSRVLRRQRSRQGLWVRPKP